MRKYLPDKYTYDNTSFTEKQGKDIVGYSVCIWNMVFRVNKNTEESLKICVFGFSNHINMLQNKRASKLRRILAVEALNHWT